MLCHKNSFIKEETVDSFYSIVVFIRLHIFTWFHLLKSSVETQFDELRNIHNSSVNN